MCTDLGRVCEEDQGILLILLDMGVAFQPNMKREGGGMGGWGRAPHQKHPSAFFLSLCLYLLLFSLFVSLPVSIIPSSLPHTAPTSITHTHTGHLSLIQRDISMIGATIMYYTISIDIKTKLERARVGMQNGISPFVCPPTLLTIIISSYYIDTSNTVKCLDLYTSKGEV